MALARPSDKIEFLWVEDDESYEGVYLGEFPVSESFPDMPAIWCPQLKRVIFGYESWWGPLKGEVRYPDEIRSQVRELLDYVFQEAKKEKGA